jgi:hypothetical protein
MEKFWIFVIELSVPGHEKVTIDDDMRFEKEWQRRRHAEAIVMNYPHLPLETHCEPREAKRHPAPNQGWTPANGPLRAC